MEQIIFSHLERLTTNLGLVASNGQLIKATRDMAIDLSCQDVSAKDAADFLGCSKRTVYRMIGAGEIKAHPINPKAKRKTFKIPLGQLFKARHNKSPVKHK